VSDQVEVATPQCCLRRNSGIFPLLFCSVAGLYSTQIILLHVPRMLIMESKALLRHREHGGFVREGQYSIQVGYYHGSSLSKASQLSVLMRECILPVLLIHPILHSPRR